MIAKGAANGRLTPGLGSENKYSKRPSWPYQFRCLHQLAPWPNQIASADTESFSQSKRVAVTTSSSSKLAIQLFKCFLHGGDCRLWVIGSQVLVLENRDKDLAPYILSSAHCHSNTSNTCHLIKTCKSVRFQPVNSPPKFRNATVTCWRHVFK
jgi:hypothetical protein